MSSPSSNNPPFIELPLDEETANFLMKNCIINIRTGLALIQSIQSRDNMERLITQIENFKKIKDLLLQQNPNLSIDY